MKDTGFQCKRCGSSISIERCLECDGDGVVGHECGEDTCSCADPEDNMTCQTCLGEGTYGVCISSSEWCEAYPLLGRENVPRHTVEEFEIA